MPTSSDYGESDEEAALMKVLVTGADGFAGRHLVKRLIEKGHQVTAGCRPVANPQPPFDDAVARAIRMVPLELSDPDLVRSAVGSGHDAVVHLAAVASVREAREDPARAWVINAAGTARLMNAVLDTGEGDPVVLVVSTAEVYGNGPARPRVETDPPCPQSSYAASKLGGEIAALEAWRRSGLRVIVARPFIHTGPGQHPSYVVPSFIRRLLDLRAPGAQSRVPTGNLELVRDLSDVRDVVEAYLLLLDRGRAGETYNIARGQGFTLREIFHRIADEIGVNAEPMVDPALLRPADIPHLVGDPGKLRQITGWSPVFSLEQTLRDMVHAQTH